MNSLPKITIVTPSFNQGQFLEETILSVTGQQYPNLEYIIFDGGSTDNSVEIIKKHSNNITYWVSEKDNGQSNAINKGFAKATGDILLWLNSDDMLMPGALHLIAEKTDVKRSAIYFGNCLHFQYRNGLTTYGSNVVYCHKHFSLENTDYIIQPSSFWTSKAWETIGQLSETLHYAFDWEWFLRAKKASIEFIAFDECISMYRIHESHKTGTGGNARDEELALIYKTYAPANERLFRYLVEDKQFLKNLSTRIVRKLSSVISYKISDTQLLSTFKKNRYKDFSTAIIEQVKQMVAYYE